MGQHVHGGDIYRYQNVIDFSANCSPLGTPQGVKEAVKRSAELLANYPQVGYAPLKRAIGNYEKVDSSFVICGNGAAELIFSLVRAVKPARALVWSPTFAEYEQALESVECEVEHYNLNEKDGFHPEENEFLSHLTQEIDMVFLCNPNNPTGVLLEKSFLVKILERAKENKIFVVVDECFLDFVGEPQHYTLKEMLVVYENLFLLKAFTKRYAMAGVRLGYGLTANGALLEKMDRVNQPWNLSVIAQEAGIAALQEEAYVNRGRELIFKEKKYLRESLEEMGMKVYDSEANYLFFKGPADLWESALEKGVRIRDCSNYSGLSRGYFRIAVRTHGENEKLVEAFHWALEKAEEKQAQSE